MSYPILYQQPDSLNKDLIKHLKSWGLRSFSDEAGYYEWQKKVLTEEEIVKLNQLGLARHGGESEAADIEFYDLAAQETILPVLYSQRYDFFLEIGCAITDRIEPARRVLDFGCGVGILTTFFAFCFPHITFVGVDRSSGSIVRARKEASGRGLANLHFKNLHLPQDALSDSFDLIICTQSLFQAEKEHGLPSLSWKSFERAGDPKAQRQVEARTGLNDRLEAVTKLLSPGGRMLLCEKAWHLGRRILLQRALASRGYHLVGEPKLFRYRAIDEEVRDGPLYEVSQKPIQNGWFWDENPTIEPGESLFAYHGDAVNEFLSSLSDVEIIQTLPLGRSPHETSTVTFARWQGCLAYGLVKSPTGFLGVIVGSIQDEKVIQQYFLEAERWTEEKKDQVLAHIWPQSEKQPEDKGMPTYENHTAIAQTIWNSLPDRQVQDQETFRQDDGREMHIEWGTCSPLTYMYWANTFDQRQLVLMTPHRAKVLEDYYQESLLEMKRECSGGN